MRPSATGRASGRRGFTLIELLVVVSIIAVLIALSAAATLRFLGVQQTTNTRTVLVKVQGQLDKQWAAVTDKARTEPIPASAKTYIQSNLADPNAPNAGERERVLFVKLRQRQMFPTSYAEVFSPLGLPPVPTYVTYLNKRGITAPTPGGPLPHESAACLLMALQRSPGGGGVQAEDFGVSNVLEFPAGGSNTIPALVDAWKTPLVFCRWPTDSPELNPGGSPQKGLNDAADPQGYLKDPKWTSTSYGGTFQSLLHKLGPAGVSYRLAPLVMSAGADRNAGVNPATLAPAGTGANDNLFSSRQP